MVEGKGRYGGITLEGSLIEARDEWNDAHYGRHVTPSVLILGNALQNPNSRGLRAALAG